MAKTLEEIKAQAQQIRRATQVGENTAERVGGTLEDVIDKMQDFNSKKSLAQHVVKMSEVGKLGCGINSQSGLEVATQAMMYTTLEVCKDDLIVVDAPQGLVVSAVLKNAAGELREVFATRAKDTLSQMLPSSAVVVPISEDCTMYLNLATNDDRPATKAD